MFESNNKALNLQNTMQNEPCCHKKKRTRTVFTWIQTASIEQSSRQMLNVDFLTIDSTKNFPFYLYLISRSWFPFTRNMKSQCRMHFTFPLRLNHHFILYPVTANTYIHSTFPWDKIPRESHCVTFLPNVCTFCFSIARPCFIFSGRYSSTLPCVFICSFVRVYRTKGVQRYLCF